MRAARRATAGSDGGAGRLFETAGAWPAGHAHVTSVAQTLPASITPAAAKPEGAGWFVPSAIAGSTSPGRSPPAALRKLTRTPPYARTVRPAIARASLSPRIEPSE